MSSSFRFYPRNSVRSIQSKAPLLILAFLLGAASEYFLLTGRWSTGPKHGFVAKLSETAVRSTSHKDKQGRPITKKQLMDAFVVPNYVGFSVATIRPGQEVKAHQHRNLHEIFFVLEGAGTFVIGDVVHQASIGSFLHVAPGEDHAIFVDELATQDLQFVVTGVTV